MSISLSDWQQAGQVLSHRNQHLKYWVGGPASAPVLLLIHGFPSASWDWEALWPTLTQHWRVVAMDMLGFGFSDKPKPHDYRIAEHAETYETLLKLLGVSDYHLLAHDYGVTVAQELLARQGAGGPRLHSLALLNGGLFPETHRPLLTQRLLLSPLGPLLAALMGKGGLAGNLRRIFGKGTPPSQAVIDGFWQLIEYNHGRRVMPKLIRYIDERREHRERWVGALQETDLPLAVINGPADPISGAHMLVRLRELVPQARVYELDGIGHYPQIEAPERVLRAYLAFRTAVG